MKHITQNTVCKVKMIALFVFTILVANVFAKPYHNQGGSSFRLLVPTNYEHTIIINNQPYTGIYNRFKIDNLRPGNHRLKIVQLVINRRGYVVNRFVLYNGFVFIPRNAKVWASVSNNGRFVVERTYRRDNGNRGGNNYRRYDNRDYENNRENNRDNGGGKHDDYYDEDWYGYNDQGSSDGGDNSNRDSDDNDYSKNDNRSNNDNSKDKNDRSTTDYSKSDNKRNNETFALTLASIKKQSFDTERLKIAKNAVAQGSMLSSEIAEITKLFSFESSRLEFAKFAYTYTIDKKNYVIVQDAFQFSSSTSELQDYITQMGRN